MLPVLVNVPVAGLYRSALAHVVAQAVSAPLQPPATNTCPLGSSVAVVSAQKVWGRWLWEVIRPLARRAPALERCPL